MKEKERILVLLHKYGMDSKYNDPYLYEKDGKVGLVYSFSHPFYGILSRCLFFEDEQELEEFLYQYWWYKKYGNSYGVTIELEDYETWEIKPYFLYRERRITSSVMKQLLVDPDKLSLEQKEVKIYQRYLRTAHILIEIISLKMKTQQDTYCNVVDLTQEWKRQDNEFLQLYNRYQKESKELHVIASIDDCLEMPKTESLTMQLKSLESQERMEDLKAFIEGLWQMLFEIESEEAHLQNKYLLIKLPLDLEDIRKKKTYMENLFNKKKSLFGKKENILEALKKIEQSSEGNKIVSMDDYVANEKQRLKEKYSIIEEMDYATLGDYLNEFDNLGIDFSFEIKTPEPILEYYHDDFIPDLQNFYQKLTMEEQGICNIYHSFLQPLCDAILTSFTEGKTKEETKQSLMLHYLDEVCAAMEAFDDSENFLLCMKDLKLVFSQTKEQLVSRLVDLFFFTFPFPTFTTSKICYVFGKSKKSQDKFSFYHATCKSSCAPVQGKGEFDVTDIIKIYPDVSFSYFPNYYWLRDPYFHDYVIEKQENREDIMIPFEKCYINIDNSDILKVVRYQVEKRFQNGIYEVVNCILDKTESYRYIEIQKG